MATYSITVSLLFMHYLCKIYVRKLYWKKLIKIILKKIKHKLNIIYVSNKSISNKKIKKQFFY